MLKEFEEGCWFTIPVEPYGLAVGLVARKKPSEPIILVYFFGELYDSEPPSLQLGQLLPPDSVAIMRVGDLGFIKGEWKVIGQTTEWDRSKWPMPDFVRREPISNRVWRVKYSEDDPGIVLSEELISESEGKNLEPNIMWGYKAAEKQLSKRLTKKFENPQP